MFKTRRYEFWAGVRAELPILLGVAPFGMLYGLLALKAGLGVGTAQAMSAVVFAGSSQFMAVQLIGAGAPALVLVGTVLVVNLRHALYSASLAPYLRPLSRSWKLLLAYLLTDEAYAVAIIHYDDQNVPRENKHWYLFGAGLALWTCWQISTAVGVFLGAQIPTSWPLDFALPLTFIALLAPVLKDRAAVLSAAAAGLTALAGAGLPYKLGLLLAALVGIGVGLWSETRSRSG